MVTVVMVTVTNYKYSMFNYTQVCNYYLPKQLKMLMSFTKHLSTRSSDGNRSVLSKMRAGLYC